MLLSLHKSDAWPPVHECPRAQEATLLTLDGEPKYVEIANGVVSVMTIK